MVPSFPKPYESYKSTFRNELKSIPVPLALQEGVNVLRVYANGKTKPSFLTLSEDKFTLHITSDKYKKPNTTRGFFAFGRRNITKADTEHERSIDIGAIHRIQRGHATRKFELASRNLRQDSQKSLLTSTSPRSARDDDPSLDLSPERCFSIIFRGDWTLDLMAGPDVNRDVILDALDNIVQTYQESKVKVSKDVLLLRYVWLEGDKEKIAVGDLGRILTNINFLMKKNQLHDLYEKFGKTIGLDRKMRRQGLTFEQCCTLLHKIKRDSWMVKPVNEAWNNLFGQFMNNHKQRTNVSAKTFLTKFFHEKQGETHMTLEDVKKLFARLNELELPHVAADEQQKDPTRIDKNRFEAYLLGEENDAFDPTKELFDEQSMNAPISEYWINSSHNTYLTGDQFTSHSRVEMYSNALYRGCRCLELDIWDGELEDSIPVPVVWHGMTMTSKILFKDIIKSIKLFLNFHPDTFPIILSFENHCSIPYQEVMAEQLVRILGDSLYIPADLSGKLPSPWDLRGMVVIKGRRPDVDAGDGDDSDFDYEDEVAESIAAMSAETVVTDETRATFQSKSLIRYGVAPQLARLTLFHGTKIKNWDESTRSPTHHMHSFSENKVKSMCRKNMGRKWAIYNQNHMTRIYPAGKRVDSSNFNPLLSWSVGCQLVALNFQTNDPSLRLNDGRFRENGGCGYVLKPSAILKAFEEIPPTPTKFSVRVLSGSCLPKPKDLTTGECIDPYVKVSVYDVKIGADKELCHTFSSGVVHNNGFFPIWNEEKFKFTIENPAVAMLQLTVYDKAALVATASIPISCLRQGLRSVKLFDALNTRSGAFDFATLLIDVKKEKP